MADKGIKERARRLAQAVATIEKQFGKGAIMNLGEVGASEVGVISTGSLGLDLALGIGGWPRGRIIELYGPESVGKSTLMLHAVAEAQRAGGAAAFVDAEHALDVGYAQALGVDLERVLVSQPDCGEQALEIANTLVQTAAVDLICVDSVAALVPRAELEGDMGDAHMGLQARLMSQAMRKLCAVTARNDVAIMFSNQLRQKIGVMWGSPETTPGGQALKFYASVRVDLRRVASIKHGDEQVGVKTRAKVVKNKCSPPFRQAEFDIMYGRGIHAAAELLDLGTDLGVVEKAGAWLSYQGAKVGNGRDAAAERLGADPKLMGALREDVRGAVLARRRAVATVSPEEGGTDAAA